LGLKKIKYVLFGVIGEVMKDTFMSHFLWIKKFRLKGSFGQVFRTSTLNFKIAV
jgi:hypothetical protein